MARYILETDGGSRGNPGPAGFGVVVRDEAGSVVVERGEYLGVTTNNVAEYSGLVAGLLAVAALDPDAHVEVRMDSRLVVEQMSGRWKIKHAEMQRLARAASEVLPGDRVRYTWVPRAENSAADRIANEAMDTGRVIARTFATGPPEESAAGAPAPASGTGQGEPVTVVLVRHGETPMTVTEAYSGSGVPGPSLTARGRVQAAQAADLVHRIGRDILPDLPRPGVLIASPMVRAQETAHAIGRRLGLPVLTDERAREGHFGVWDGLTADEIDERWPGALDAWHTTGTTAPPGGESIAAVGERTRELLDDLLREHAGRTVVVVAHAVSIRSVLGQCLLAPPGAWWRLRMPAASVSLVQVYPDGLAKVHGAGWLTER